VPLNSDVRQRRNSIPCLSQIGNGFVLTCVAYATADCTITTHQEEELY